jgi:hypothetical protein
MLRLGTPVPGPILARPRGIRLASATRPVAARPRAMRTAIVLGPGSPPPAQFDPGSNFETPVGGFAPRRHCVTVITGGFTPRRHGDHGNRLGLKILVFFG